jgi:hypothetical protein
MKQILTDKEYLLPRVCIYAYRVVTQIKYNHFALIYSSTVQEMHFSNIEKT